MEDLSVKIQENPDFQFDPSNLPGKELRSERLLFSLISLFFIFLIPVITLVKIPVYISARGTVRPASGVYSIKTPVSGRIKRIYTFENEYVSGGQIILSLESQKETEYLVQTIRELEEIRMWLKDLRVLYDASEDSLILLTARYSSEYSIFLQENEELILKLHQSEADYLRSQRLYQNQYISLNELERSSLQFNTLKNQKAQLLTRKKEKWHSEYIELQQRERDLSHRFNELQYFRNGLDIKAPRSGTIQSIENKYTGEYCPEGFEICLLIPDTALVAEIFVLPEDIGFLRTGQAIKLKIDSYDYRYWGTLNTICSSISKDPVIIGEHLFFKICCNLDPRSSLIYRESRVSPKNGMSLTANFIFREKTIWQLIRDRVSLIYSPLI